MIEYLDKVFQLFVNLHQQAIVEGGYQRYGSKTVTKPRSIQENDFVMILNSDALRPKYGIIEKKISKHRVSVRMLTKRNKDGSGSVGNQTLNIVNIVHLYTPKKQGV